MTAQRKLAKWSAIALALSVSACSASLVSHHVATNDEAAEKQEFHGLFYTLPRTVIRISLPVKLKETKAGKFDKFAELFFPGETLTAGRSFRVGQANFTTRGEPDPRQVYYMRVEGRGAMEQALTFSFSEQGSVTGLKTVTTNRTAEVVLAAVGAASSILTKTVLAGDAAPAILDDCDSRVPVEPGTDRIDKGALEDYLLSCFLGGRPELQSNYRELSALNSDPQRTERHKKTRHHLLEAFADVEVTCANGCSSTRQTPGKKRRELEEAMKTYLFYATLLENRNDALQNAAVTGFDGLVEVVERMDDELKRLRGEFIGVKQADQEWTGIFDVLPDECNAQRTNPCASWKSQILLSYAPHQGLCLVDSRALLVSPAPQAVMAPLDETTGQRLGCSSARALLLELTLADAPGSKPDQLATRIANNFRRPTNSGMHYIVPAQMLAVIRIEQPAPATPEELESSKAQLMIAQHGIVAAMPATLGGKAMTHDVAFYEASGALKSYNLISSPMIDKGLVDSLSSSANALLDARLKQQQAETEAADPLTRIKKEKDILEGLLAIQKACAELEDPPEACGG
jgi:hypothetical protein